jgi:hypothetical protein
MTLRDKRLMDLARSGDFDACRQFIEQKKIRTLPALVKLLHSSSPEPWQFDVYADAMRTTQEMKTLCPPR